MSLKDLIFNQDELPASEEQIALAEKLWGTKFPQDYKSFLLKQNGGEVYPNTPSIQSSPECELWYIERFCSVNDLILQKQYAMGYTYIEQHYEEDLEPFRVSRNDLLTIAVAERGCYYINIGKKQYGQIYHANYQGGEGIVKLKTNSFTEFLNSFKPFIDEEFEGFGKTRKIYDTRYYQTPDQPKLGIERFKEVLSFLGDANSKSTPSDWTVIQYYAYVNPYDKMGNYLLEYLLNNGGKTEGLLLRTKHFDTIKMLINEYGADINQPYNDRYPIHMMTGSSSGTTAKDNYELLDKLLSSDIEIDFSVQNNRGETAIDRVKKLVVEYEKYRAYDKERKKRHPEQHNFMTSDAIMKLIES